MRISEMLKAIASWLESPNNEAILLAEYDDDCLKIVAESCVEASFALRKAAEQVDVIEPEEESKITPESLQELAEIATAFDASGDENLKKQASVIDELLLTIAAPKSFLTEKKAAENQRLEELKKKYHNEKTSLESNEKIADAHKAIEKSQMTKRYDVMEAPLSSRYCPDHPGVQTARIGEHIVQCELDKKTYNFETGYKLNNGLQVPGVDVSNQSQHLDMNFSATFDSRQDRLNSNK